MTLFNRLFNTDKWHGRFLISLIVLSLLTASVLVTVLIFVSAPKWVPVFLIICGASALIATLD